MRSGQFQLTTTLALALALGCTVACGSVYTVGQLPTIGNGDFFSASWLHDATGARNVASGSEENGAYRSGQVSGAVSGSLYGELLDGKLVGIGGVLHGNLSKLLKTVDAGLKNQNFTMKLGQEIGESNTGALRFNTDGVGAGSFTGGFIDYLLEVPGVPGFSLTGTFFFKPQAETGSSALSPNRGDGQGFTLWGYNWMHDSGPINPADPAGAWSFLDDLGYTGGVVNRAPFTGNLVDGHTLGIALFADGANPEPTTFLIWGGLSMLALAARRR
jgi:hypothetical protein